MSDSRRGAVSDSRAADAALFVLLLCVVAWRAAPQLAGLLGIETSRVAPDVQLTSIDGDVADLEALRGKVVVVTFWATWCRQCGPGMRALQDIEGEYGEDDVAVMAISLGAERELDIRQYLAERGLDLWVGQDFPALRARFGGVPGVPTTFIIDRSGYIRHRLYGPLSELALGTVVARLARRPVDVSSTDPETPPGRDC